ncbi:hypothetical protein JCM1841_006429 [Sporobolomyces salmonicolor]
MSTSTTLNRLAGLPKIPKLKKKSATSPKKSKSIALPPPPPPPPAPAPLPPAPVVLPFPLNPSDDDTLSEPSSSSSSEDGDVVPLAKSVPPPRKTGQAVEDVCLVCHGSCRCGGAEGASVYVGGSAPLASSSTAKPAPAPKKASATPYDPKLKMKSSKPSTSSSSSHKPFTSTTYRPTSSTSAPRPPPPSYLPPLPPAYSDSPTTSSKPRGRPRKDGSNPKLRSIAQTAADASYSPSTSVARPAAPQRMSLRQVLALSLQEAEQQSKSREGTPDANEILNAARGRAGGNKKEGGVGKEKLSDVSDLELDAEESSSSEEERSRMDVDGASEDELGGMEKEEERLLREEIERRKRKKGKEAEALYDDSDEDDDDEGLLEAWDQNVRAMEQLRRRRSSGAAPGADASFEQDEDSDVAITEVPPGNGLGVVTWSDYDSFGSDDEEEQEDQLAEALAARQAHGGQALFADSFEDELEELFALSEAVVGPIRQDEYDAGDMWFEALSDFDGSSADDESGEDDDDIDAEMIFGEHGELKKLFGGRRNKRRHSAVESSAGESDSDDEQATESEADLDVELVRVGIELSRADNGKGKGKEEEEDGDDETASYHSEDEQTDSSCSDTDIYRYAPRTGALANLQAPTTADLASLNADSVLVDMNQLKKSTSGTHIKSAGGASSSSSRPAPASASAASKQKGKGKGPLPVIREERRIKRRAPTMGTFDTSERKKTDAMSGGLTIVVVDDSDVPAPSPFRAAKKASKRRMLEPTPSRRTRTGSHVSTTSATSGSVSLDPGSNVGSPVLANVKLEFDLDSMLQESVFEDETEVFLATGGSSSETDVGDATATDAASSKPASALSDFSRWNRIPIGAFRSRTMRGTGADAPSQVLTAKAAASERGHKKKKSTAGGVATSILRDHKAVATSLHHTLGSPGAAKTASKRAIRSRMLTSPVLAPVLPNSSSSHISPPRPGFAAAAAAAAYASKKAKRSKKSTPAGSVRSKSPASRSHSRQASVVASTSAAPTANLPPLHSPLFRTVSMTEPSLLPLE